MAIDEGNAQARAVASLLATTKARKGAVATPFRFVRSTSLGEVEIDVVSGDRAEFAGAPVPGAAARMASPLRFAGRGLIVRASLARKGDSWVLRDLDVVAHHLTGEARVALPPEIVASLREEIPRAMGPVLDAERRRFVERELTDLHGERASLDDAMAQVRSEIARRRAKLRSLARARKARADASGAREAALRAELATLAAG